MEHYIWKEALCTCTVMTLLFGKPEELFYVVTFPIVVAINAKIPILNRTCHVMGYSEYDGTFANRRAEFPQLDL